MAWRRLFRSAALQYHELCLRLQQRDGVGGWGRDGLGESTDVDDPFGACTQTLIFERRPASPRA